MTITAEILPSAPEREIKKFLPIDIAQENVPEKMVAEIRMGGASSSGILKLFDEINCRLLDILYKSTIYEDWQRESPDKI